jgi:hypothetical protein
MLNQTALAGPANTASGNRVFVYEIEGLRQNPETDKNEHAVRRSGSVFLKVPYSRMNEEMRRINRLGGRIVNIHPLKPGEE